MVSLGLLGSPDHFLIPVKINSSSFLNERVPIYNQTLFWAKINPSPDNT
jgi:hypothetical protein